MVIRGPLVCVDDLVDLIVTYLDYYKAKGVVF